MALNLYRPFLALVCMQLCASAQSAKAPEAKQVFQPPGRLIIEYGLSGGLFNQHACHFQAIILAEALNASTVDWPPARDRQTFAMSSGKQTWHWHDARDVYDMDAISKYFADRLGIEIAVRSPDGFEPPRSDLIHLCERDGRTSIVSVPVGTPVHTGRQDAAAFVAHVEGRIEELRRAHPDLAGAPVRVQLTDTFGMMTQLPPGSVVVQRGLDNFSHEAEEMADQVIAGMERMFGSKPRFNALHLRMEADAMRLQDNVGGRKGLWELYKQAMKEGDIDGSAPMYVASGLIEAGWKNPTELARLMFYASEVLCNKWGKRVVFKEMFVRGLDRHGLQKRGLVDFLVMRRAAVAVGIGSSTFFGHLAVMRNFDGQPRNATLRVDTPPLPASQEARTELATRRREQEERDKTLY